ncbi:hypothetical protein BC826DRAFT_690375 [Russula brevipes]|nr:hypothetical protein BC826DRAFT_690375 [Russula brevipes]
MHSVGRTHFLLTLATACPHRGISISSTQTTFPFNSEHFFAWLHVSVSDSPSPTSTLVSLTFCSDCAARSQKSHVCCLQRTSTSRGGPVSTPSTTAAVIRIMSAVTSCGYVDQSILRACIQQHRPFLLSPHVSLFFFHSRRSLTLHSLHSSLSSDEVSAMLKWWNWPVRNMLRSDPDLGIQRDAAR